MRSEQEILDLYRGYGREDVLLEGYPNRSVRYDFEEDAHYHEVEASKLESAYERGKREAEQEKQRNFVLFYLNELLKSMDAGSEWYGTDFDEPMWIVRQVINQIATKS